MMKRRRCLTAAALAALILTALCSACVGGYPMTAEQIIHILFGNIRDSMESRIFWQLRLPRVAMGMASGAALGLAGGIYQTMFGNALASPDLTGVASGASFGAACAIVLGAGGGMQIMAGSFFMGMLSLVLVLLLVRASGIEKTGSYILAGIIISSLADAGLMILKSMADPQKELAAIEFWTMGSLAAMTDQKLLPQMAFIAVPMVLLLAMHRQVLMLSMGTEHARSVGLSPGLWRAVFLGLSTLMIAAVVSVAGVIAFVGLIAPHIAFLLTRRRDGGYFAMCALTGSIVLLIADVLARVLAGGVELPLSILTVLLSVPMLLVLLCGRKGKENGAGI